MSAENASTATSIPFEVEPDTEDLCKPVEIPGQPGDEMLGARVVDAASRTAHQFSLAMDSIFRLETLAASRPGAWTSRAYH